MKPPDKMRPMCRHCFASIQVQRRIDGGEDVLNIDGSPHKCHGAYVPMPPPSSLVDRRI